MSADYRGKWREVESRGAGIGDMEEGDVLGGMTMDESIF